MIVCPNCNHQNPDGATQCEACLTPLPATTSCFNCGTTVQADAAFCGQCGIDLRQKGEQEQSQTPEQPDASVLATVVSGPIGQDVAETPAASVEETVVSSGVIPDLEPVEPLVESEPIGGASVSSVSSVSSEMEKMEEMEEVKETSSMEEEKSTPPSSAAPVIELSKEEAESSEAPSSAAPVPTTSVRPASTQLQLQSAFLLHIRTNTQVELPTNLSVIHVGKPNERIPPDIDVSGFPDAEVVSRVHADIRIEGDSYYIEDIGSSNGTYINNNPLLKGNRHKLREGDRISFGKGDLVSFLFKVSSLN